MKLTFTLFIHLYLYLHSPLSTLTYSYLQTYFRLRDALTRMELVVLRVLNYELSVDLAHTWVAAMVHDLRTLSNKLLKEKDDCILLLLLFIHILPQSLSIFLLIHNDIYPFFFHFFYSDKVSAIGTIAMTLTNDAYFLKELVGLPKMTAMAAVYIAVFEVYEKLIPDFDRVSISILAM